MVPGQIELLIQIHVFPFMDQLTQLNGSPAASEWIQMFIHEDLIESDPDFNPDFNPATAGRLYSPYETTPRGRALIEKWCKTPLPVLEEKWV